MPGPVRVGISGWTYKPWRGVFYPVGLARKKEPAYAASLFPSIEINGTFYSLQRPSSFAAWDVQTPPDFVFAIKGSRYITHMLRLRGAEQPLANFLRLRPARTWSQTRPHPMAVPAQLPILPPAWLEGFSTPANV